jgi:FdhD protein
MTGEGEPLALAILRVLAQSEDPARADAGMSLPRLGKRLGQGVSVLMRQLTLMGDAAVGGERGPGWVVVAEQGGHWTARLTDAGRAVAQALPAAEATP